MGGLSLLIWSLHAASPGNAVSVRLQSQTTGKMKSGGVIRRMGVKCRMDVKFKRNTARNNPNSIGSAKKSVSGV